MKSKNPKIQILKKGIATFMSAMLLVTPLAYATTSLDDSYLEATLWEKILYGTIGSTAKEIEEYLASHSTLYITNETQLRAFAEYGNNGDDYSGKEIVLLNDIELNLYEEWIPIERFNGKFYGNNHTISGLICFNENESLEEWSIKGFLKETGTSAIIKNLTLKIEEEGTIANIRFNSKGMMVSEGEGDSAIPITAIAEFDTTTVTYTLKKIEEEIKDVYEGEILKAGDRILIVASFDKFLANDYGPLTAINREEAPTLKINNSIDTETVVVNTNSNDYTSNIEYTYTVQEGESFDIENLTMYNNTTSTIYAVGTDYQTNHPSIDVPSITTQISKVIVDAQKPTVEPEIPVENALESQRYTAGKDIIIAVTTSEIIKGDENRPELEISFSESGVGQYNYNGQRAGLAKCIDAKINLDGTTTWTYIYQIQQFDEGELQIKYVEGSIVDLAGNTTNLVSDNYIEIKEEDKIYADTTAPTVKITPVDVKNNVTNENRILYKFTWSEKVTGFALEYITVNNGIIEEMPEDINKDNKFDQGDYDALYNYVNETSSEYNSAYDFNKDEKLNMQDLSILAELIKKTNTKDNEYLIAINTSTLDGNVGELQVIVEQDACTDLVGLGNVRTESVIRVDKKAPILINLEAYATSDITLNKDVDVVKEFYKEGDKITVIATFDENIVVEKIPELALEFSESGNAKGSVTGVAGGNKLVYTYTIKSEDQGKLSVKGFSGTVKDAIGNETVVTKRTLEGDTIIADTDAPNLQELNVITEEGTYNAGEEITIEAVYDEEVYSLKDSEIKNMSSELAPILKIKFGNSAEREAIFKGYVGEDKSKLKYTVSIVDGDNGELSLTSYTNKENVKVCDIAGNEASLNVNQTGNQIIADTIRPEVTNIVATVENPSISGTDIYYKEGNEIKITLTFSEEVSGNSVEPKIKIGFSETEDQIPEMKEYSTISTMNENSTTIEYIYQIKNGDNGYLWVEVLEGQFKDIADNTNITKDAIRISNVFADTTIPTVTLYRDTEEIQNGQEIKIIAKFNENVYDLDGESRITLTNANAPKLIYSFGNGANKETTDGEATVKGDTITYTITKDKVEDDGDFHYELAKGNLCDRAGNELYKTTLDTTAPVLRKVVIMPSAGIYDPYCREGKDIYVMAEFSESISSENMKLEATVGGKEIPVIDGEIIESNDTIVKFTYTVKAGDMGKFEIVDICGEVATQEKEDYGWVEDKHGNRNNIYSFADEGVTPTGYAEADTKDPYITSIKALVDDKEIATYTKEEGKDPVIVVGRTNANIVEYIVTYSEKVPYSHFENISITNGIIRTIEYTDLELNEYKITVQTNYEGVQSLIINEATVEDKAGNTDEFVRLNAVTVDLEMPRVIFKSEYNGGVYVLPTNIGKVEIRPNVEISEDISKIEYKWDNEEYVEINNYSSSSDISVPSKAFTEEGQYKLFIKVTDLAGNVAETSKTYEVLYSNIEIDVDTTDYTNQDVTATVTFGEGLTDNRKVTFKAEGSEELVELNAVGTNENGTEYTIWTNGTIYAEATDKIGNKVFTERTIYNIDKEKPEVELSLNGANLVIGTGKDKAIIKTKVDVNEPVTIKYYWNGTEKYGDLKDWEDAPLTSEEGIIELQLNSASRSGECYLNVKAIDKAGNETIVKSNPFIVLDTNEREKITTTEGENGPEETKEIIPAEKPVSELIIFEQMKEDEKDKAYVYVDYDYSIIKDLDITLADKTYGYISEYNSIELYGNTTIIVKAWDVCGNEIRHEYKVEDIVGPEFTISGNPETWTSGDVRLEVNSKTELKSLTVNGENILSKDKNTYGFKDITEYGSYVFEAIDIYNNKSNQTVEVKIDKSAPEITDVKIENGVIVITATDDLSGLAEYAITDTTEVPLEWSTSNVINVTKDENFFVWAKDNAGNIYMKEQIVVRDTTAPELTITTDVELDKWTNTNIKVDVKFNEELKSLVIKYKENEEEKEVDILEAKTYTITANGTYEIIAEDKSGNKTTEKVKVTKIDKTAPEISSAVPNGKDITISATDVESEVKEYAITSTTEVPVEWSTSNVIKVTEDGTFYAWVRDNAGNVSRAENTIVVDTTAPTITFNYLSQTVTVGMPLEAYILTNEEATISYSWDKENWTVSEGYLTAQKVSEKSTAPGTYTLYAKVTDKAGNESAIQTLEFTVTNMEEIKQPEIVFEDIPTIQINGTRYVKVSSDMTIEGLTDKMNGEALCGETPEYTKLTEDGKLKTGSEIAINGSIKYVIVVNGDVNCDGKIDFLGDVILANDYRIGIGTLSTIQRLAADINNDGKVDFISDILAINDYRIGITKSL